MSLASQARANALVTRSAGLLSLPPTYTTLRLILDDPQGTTQQMCGSIFASTALCTALMRLLGGPLHRPGSGTWSVERAVNQFGMQRMVDLALVASLPAAVSGLSAGVSASGFWTLALRGALAARLLAEASARSERDRMFATGMLMPLGLALMWQSDAAAMKAVGLAGGGSGEARLAAERRLFGTDHVHISAAVARHWQLPAPLLRSLASCEEPARAVPHHYEAAVLKLARSVAAFPGSLPDYDPLALDMLRLSSRRVDEIADALTHLQPEVARSLKLVD